MGGIVKLLYTQKRQLFEVKAKIECPKDFDRALEVAYIRKCKYKQGLFVGHAQAVCLNQIHI